MLGWGCSVANTPSNFVPSSLVLSLASTALGFIPGSSTRQAKGRFASRLHPA